MEIHRNPLALDALSKLSKREKYERGLYWPPGSKLYKKADFTNEQFTLVYDSYAESFVRLHNSQDEGWITLGYWPSLKAANKEYNKILKKSIKSRRLRKTRLGKIIL